MPDNLSQDEINSLLSPSPGGQAERAGIVREKLYKQYLDNKKTFTSAMLFELIALEMKIMLDKGQEINLIYMKKEIPGEEAKKRAEALGQGTWWGGESEWYITEVRDFKVSARENTLCTLRAVCSMEYISSHTVYGRDKPRQRDAVISMKITDGLYIEEFTFSWK
jgi:hypothetical protein